jgi:AcrR family transcriptional regulator
MTETIDTRQLILDAAIKRILHYGYAKTTMSEIARDCDMSAGNIYRFFASKIDIAEAMARKFHTDGFQAFASFAREDGPAAERFRRFFMYALEQTFERVENDAKILEVADVLKQERPTYYNEHLAQERIYLVKILNDGADSGEFRQTDNPEETAEFMQSALMKYRYPQLFSKLSLPKLKRELEGVLSLLLAGLSASATEL